LLQSVNRKIGSLRAIQPLKNPAFRMYFFSRVTEAVGMNMRQISLSLLLYRITGSTALLGIMVLARAIPMIVVPPFAGALADRIQKKYVVQLGGILNVFIALGIAIPISTGYLGPGNTGSWWLLILASFLDGIFSSIRGPAADAMIVEVVGRDIITSAVAVNQIGQNTFRLAAPALAGVMIDELGFEFVFYLMAAVYIASVVFMVFIPPVKQTVRSGINLFKDLAEVWKYMKEDRNILYILATVLCIVFFAMPYQQLLPVFTDDILKVGATGLGILQSISGIGSIAGSIAIASMPGNRHRGAWMLISSAILGAALAAFAFTRSWPLALGLMVIVGIGQSGRMSLPVSMLQYYVKPEFRGRVMSFYGVEIGLSSLGTFAAALMASTIGVQWSVGGLAMVLAAGSIIALLFWKRMRNLN
jgi:MFS family permease